MKLTWYLLIVCFVSESFTTKNKHSGGGGKQGLKYLLQGIGGGYRSDSQILENNGLWPSVFNLATKALISVNATCGEGGREEFCRMSENGRGRCGICDNFSPDTSKKHSIHYAIDGSSRWWQSPALYYGQEYEHVTITLDLKQVYQVAYVIIKAANAPRPGLWILEKSVNGVNYEPWQYFARSDKECLERYGIVATKGKPHYFTDSEVICSSYFSKLTPLENGEVHTFLIQGRPGANESSPELFEFTKARFVRLRFQGFRASLDPIPRWLSQDTSKDKRLFYSIRDISIGGQCVCNGHAASCRHNVASGHPECECSHHTCGPNCEKCCPMFNQRQWGPGSSRDSRQCVPCNCNGHATSCHYEESVDKVGLSMDTDGNYQGGGVCDNCTGHTTGINCEKCLLGFYRPTGTLPDAKVSCFKCECDKFGSSGICEQYGVNAGKCECRAGYKGMNCGECAPGYRGYPNCELCPCDPRGTIQHHDCENDCVCKPFADGRNCDHCKQGHFALRYDNREGCATCYCSAVTTLCESAVIAPKKFESLENWQITDISINQKVTPEWDPDARTWIVGNYEIPNIEAYYWLAPEEYLGNKLETYGSYFTFKVQWIVMRGDTSGKPTAGPNIILVGRNGMKIGCGEEQYTGKDMTFQIKMQEYDWYHVPSSVKDIITRLRRTEYKGDPVSRFQFLSVLTDIKYVLLRATFHTDQIETMLESAVLDAGVLGENEDYSSVEKCSCPSGYTGLSCESCDYGYVRIVTNTSAHQEQGFCVKCDCNGHSRTCNPDTGECFCEHNTIGEKCERCAPGYYGNPLGGTQFDCKKCACPLLEPDNNFSPSCQLDFFVESDEETGGYVCTQCPKGYTGDHCELCDDGYFGNPYEIGSKCEPCSCGGGPCDRNTGQCLGCPGNTEGWRCEKCKQGYFGDPVNANCQACLCDSFGSLSSECDNKTGECLCKPHFIGRTCDTCERGYGNVTALCTICSCNAMGSKSDICDSHTGTCDCKLGIEGFRCDACQYLHYGFSENGCESCNCNVRGSELSTCDIRTGQCRCKQNYVGRTCDKCREGYWESIDGCIKCQCDVDGSYSNVCDEGTGRCRCKPGIGGMQCNNCIPNYYGFSTTGCKECEPCNRRGHICDPDTGRCICPPYSHGEFCQLCTVNAWGYEPNKGCKTCNCSNSGSLKMQCDLATGECNCRLGYTGFNCERCDHGYFGYPRCRRCNCNYAGTDPYKARCNQDGICQCNDDGSCACKANVAGKRCDQCKEGTFGQHLDNPDGCTQCFCFGRSSKCTESGLTWGQIRMSSNRELTVKHTQKVHQIETSEKLLVIPEEYGNVTIARHQFDSPLYWRLQPAFNGDRILSYGGYIRFVCNTINPKQRLSQDVLNHYPLIQLRGHGKIVLEYYPLLPIKGNRYEIRLHESLWKRIYPKETNLSPRELFMVALQNVQNIFIKATEYSVFESVSLSDVILDTAIEIPGHPPPLAKGVELCECPRQYNSSSCQDPSIGFFRYYVSTSVNGTILIETFVGQARPCDCNNRSDVCDIETGFCKNCRDNTDGRYCDRCAEGYYGNPMNPSEKCQPCPCPSPTQNFAKDCTPLGVSQFVCKCKPGYTGPKCDRCSAGYYGQLQLPGGSCQPCNCNEEGRISDECDVITGACFCKPGITGKYCSQCEKPRHVLQEFKCTPCDICTQTLLDDLDQLSNDLDQNTHFLLNGTIEPPWGTLRNIEKRYVFLNDKLSTHLQQKQLAEELIANTAIIDLDKRLDKLQTNLKEYKTDDEALQNIQKDVIGIGGEIASSKQKLEDLIKMLQNFGKSHVNTKEAIQKAQELLNEIEGIKQNMNFSHKEVLSRCEEIKKVIEEIMTRPMPDPQVLKDDLSAYNDRLKDLEGIVTKVEITKNEADLMNRANTIRLEQLQKTIGDIKEKSGKSIEELTDARLTMEKTFQILDNIRVIYRDLDTDGSFKGLIEQLEGRDAELHLIDAEEIRQLVVNHVIELQRNASEYAKLFNLSNKEIDALKASEAYANIKKFIDEASRLANGALNDINAALDTLTPEGKDSIAVNASIAIADSERLQIRVNHQIDNLAGLKHKNDSISSRVNTLDSSNWHNGLKNRDQDKLIVEIKNGISFSNKDKIQDLITDAIEHTNRVKDIHRKAISIEVSKDYELIKPYQKLLNLTSADNLRKLQEQIKVTEHELQNVLNQKYTTLDIIKQNTIKSKEFRASNDSVFLKLQALKAQIESTKKTADGIRISLTGASCQRSYKISTLSPTVVSKLLIKFNYTLNAESNNHSLFYVNSSVGQFMNLKLQNNHLVFEMKLGNKVKTKDYALSQSDFYTVEIKRIGDHIEMVVNNDLVDESVLIDHDLTNDSDFTIFKASPQNLVHIGYSPDTELGTPGCIRDVIFNNFRIGLWNFHSSQGQCLGCIRSNELTLESTYDFYGGEGYSIISKEQQEKYANPTKFNVQFSLRTFDENALLFLAPDPERKNYIAIFLKDGYIYYQIHYPNDEDLILISTKRCNLGEKVRVSAEKEWKTKQDTVILRINDVPITLKKNDVDRASLVRLKRVNYYFGGVPPNYLMQSAGVTESLHTHQSFLGGLEELKEYQLFSDDNMKKYGITKQSGELNFHKVLFEGLGHLSVKIKTLKKSLRFILYTKSSNGFILYMESAMTMCMNEGKLVVKLYADAETYTLTSKQSTNDEVHHFIEVIRYNNKATLKIDGTVEATVNTKEIVTSETENAQLYLGGVPEPFSHLLVGNSIFSGGISDILIDDKLVTFNKDTIDYFEKVKIGRQPDLYKYFEVPKNFKQEEETKMIEVKEMKEMQNTQGCGVPLNYTFDPDAAKFGDKSFSHVLHFLKDTFWRKDYKLAISFRTYQPNGMLFASFGPKQHFNLLEVRNGKIAFKSNGKRLRSVELPQIVDDGNWYSVIVDASGVKKKRKLTVSINGYKTKPLKLPRNKVTRELYIGGISDNVTLPILLRDSLQPFKGCIRGLTINKVPQGLVRDKNTVHYNIGQCFPDIEQGSYFGGDAYAVFNKFFRINKVLDLSLEFRTAEQNGILLSVSNPRNSPALSVELQNGAIVMATDNGYGAITNVTSNSDFALCDNHWHNVTAVYTSTEINIKVDGVIKIWVQSDDETLMDELEAPLYIGGLPDYAPVGTLKMKENFKGCIRNMKIDSEMVDWLKVEKATNVLLDSCPMTT